jgi:hypothetical protein
MYAMKRKNTTAITSINLLDIGVPSTRVFHTNCLDKLLKHYIFITEWFDNMNEELGGTIGGLSVIQSKLVPCDVVCSNYTGNNNSSRHSASYLIRELCNCQCQSVWCRMLDSRHTMNVVTVYFRIIKMLTIVLVFIVTVFKTAYFRIQVLPVLIRGGQVRHSS